MNMKPIKVLFFGTTEFSAKCLNRLFKDSQFSIQAVVTKPPQTAGRGMKKRESPVHTLAKKMKKSVTVWTPKTLKDSSALKPLQALEADALVVVDYGLILPPYLFEWFPGRIFNIHTSLLPRWRGAAPISRCLLAGDQKTGVTLQKMIHRLDAGDIIHQLEFKISEDMHSLDLLQKMEGLSFQLLTEYLPPYLKGEIQAVPQDEGQAAYAEKIEKSHLQIDWSQTSQEIFNQVRAMVIKNGAVAFYRGLRLKIWSASRDNEAHQEDFGKILLYDKEKGLKVACGQGFLYLQEVQLEGRKPQKIAPFLRGFSLKAGDVFDKENAKNN